MKDVVRLDGTDLGEESSPHQSRDQWYRRPHLPAEQLPAPLGTGVESSKAPVARSGPLS